MKHKEVGLAVNVCRVHINTDICNEGETQDAMDVPQPGNKANKKETTRHPRALSMH
jgi:hypothetical protein